MILQRLAGAIREQNWMTVVIEVMVVVIGILIGLQVDGWNQYRKDRILERNYLERILQDLSADHAGLAGSVKGIEAKTLALVAVQDTVRSGDIGSSSADSFLVSISQSVTYGWSPPSVRSITFDDLQSSGQMALIREAELRIAISTFYFLSVHRSERIDARKSGYPALVFQLLGPEAGGSVRAYPEESGGKEVEVSEGTAERLVETFIASAPTVDLLRHLNAERNYATFLTVQILRQLEEIGSLQAQIEEVLGHP